jgi:hypothetical protein
MIFLPSAALTGPSADAAATTINDTTTANCIKRCRNISVFSLPFRTLRRNPGLKAGEDIFDSAFIRRCVASFSGRQLPRKGRWQPAAAPGSYPLISLYAPFDQEPQKGEDVLPRFQTWIPVSLSIGCGAGRVITP